SLKHYIFGNILYLRREDLILLLIISAITFVFVMIFWKHMKTILFDFDYAKSIGLPIKYIELIFLFLLATITIVSVEMIGVIMYAGLLIGPGIAARQISNSYNRVIILSSMIGAISGIIGSTLSASPLSPPAGPTIITVLGIIVIISIVLSRNGEFISLIKSILIARNHNIKNTLSHLTTHMIMNPRDCDIREFSIKENQDAPICCNHLSENLHLLTKLNYVKPLEQNNWVLTFKGMLMVDELKISNQIEEIL
ncbi:MAG: metal ABC transporter permease, partial [Candidatus Heimdallarchaeota archaeon]